MDTAAAHDEARKIAETLLAVLGAIGLPVESTTVGIGHEEIVLYVRDPQHFDAMRQAGGTRHSTPWGMWPVRVVCTGPFEPLAAAVEHLADCQGRAAGRCPRCVGSGLVEHHDPDGGSNPQDCPRCAGDGRVPCAVCGVVDADR